MFDLEKIKSTKYISLETYRKNNQAVKTPVMFVIKNDSIVIVTRDQTGKVKRIRKNQKARIAANAAGALQKANMRLLEAREIYTTDPNKCRCCDISLPYETRNNKYCSRSCAARINNIGVSRNKKKQL